MQGRRRRSITDGTVVITGAASGIGRALAERLSWLGAAVVIADIDEQGLKETEKSLPGRKLARVLDVRDADAQLALAAEVRESMRRPVTAVFNNAGVAVAATVLDAAVADDEWLWDINFRGVVNGVRAFLPILVEQNSGAIVNVSSVYGLVGMPHQSAYCAAKFAVRGFTDSLRQELRGTGVRAITVHPGGVDTGIVRHGRIHDDPLGLGRTKEELARDFAVLAMTTPDRAAEIIHDGVERGKARILVGRDARMFDALARLAPTRYYDVIAALEPRVLARRKAAAGRTEPT